MPRGRKGGAFEDFRFGYGRCIVTVDMFRDPRWTEQSSGVCAQVELASQRASERESLLRGDGASAPWGLGDEERSADRG